MVALLVMQRFFQYVYTFATAALGHGKLIKCVYTFRSRRWNNLHEDEKENLNIQFRSNEVSE